MFVFVFVFVFVLVFTPRRANSKRRTQIASATSSVAVHKGLELCERGAERLELELMLEIQRFKKTDNQHNVNDKKKIILEKERKKKLKKKKKINKYCSPT